MSILKGNSLTQTTGKVEVVDRNKNNIFAFWESDSEMPAYLKLCMQTWHKNIPNCEVHIINYKNIKSYIGSTYDLDKLKKIPLAMQSDIISAAVLEKFGGLFLDVDCIVIDDVFEIFNLISKKKLIAFGVPQTSSIHLAVIYSFEPDNPILRLWRVEAQRRLENISSNYRWDYFGNSIVNPLLKSDLYKHKHHIIERSVSGNILESAVIIGANHNTVIDDYKNFYFNKYLSLRPEVLSLAKCGVISLHNSWTPHQYKNIKNIDDFLNYKLPIVDILKFSMRNDRATNYNALPIVEAFVADRLSSKNITYKIKYFRGMLVLDFKVNHIEFAFDIISNEGYIDTFLVVRSNNQLEKLQDILFQKNNIYGFRGNRVELSTKKDKEEVAVSILNIYETISNIEIGNSIPFDNDLIEDNVFLDLKNISIQSDVLFIYGVCIPIGVNVKNYNDIDYTLIIKGKEIYRRPLAKDNKPELSKKYSDSYDVSYDKCWFTTYGHKGINISDITQGEYVLEIEIKVNDSIKTQTIRSGMDISIGNNTFNFLSNSTSNKIYIN